MLRTLDVRHCDPGGRYSKDDKVVGTYDPKAQIHAGWLVWRSVDLLQKDQMSRIFEVSESARGAGGVRGG